MALGCLKPRLLPFVVFCLIFIVSPSLPEIHRARSVQTFKHRFRKADTDGKSVVNEWSKWFENKVYGHSRGVWLYSSISAGLIGLTGLFPLLVIPVNYGTGRNHRVNRGKLRMLLSFAVGGLLGDVFLHLLPEAWIHVDTTSGALTGYRKIGGWILAGLLSFYLVERLFGDKEEDDFDDVDDVEDSGDKKEETKDVDASSNKEETLSTNSDDSMEGNEKSGFARSIRRERSGHIICTEKSKQKIRKRSVKKSSKSNIDVVPSSSSSLLSLSSSSSSSMACHDLAPVPSSPLESESCSSQISQVEEKKHIKVSGWLNLLANVVDNFTHGLAVAGSYSISTKMGILTTLAILLHEIPHEIGDFAILLQAGFDRWKAAKVQVLTATGGIIGALAALSAESAKILGDSTAWILPFTAGGFINIALITIMPDLLKDMNLRNSIKQLLLVCTGILVMGLVTMLVD